MASVDLIVDGNESASIVGKAEESLRAISENYFIIFDGPWIIENTKTVPNPDIKLLNIFKEMLGLEIKEPTYLSCLARVNVGNYNRFANTISFDSWLFDDDEMRFKAHSHELAHAFQSQYNKRLVKLEWGGIKRRMQGHPEIASLVTSFGRVGSLLKLQGTKEDDYIKRLYNAMGAMISLFVPRKMDEASERWVCENEKLTEGFAEWITAKIVPCRVNPNERSAEREAAFQTFRRLEERLGQAGTVGIALSAASDQEFAAITSKYL